MLNLILKEMKKNYTNLFHYKTILRGKSSCNIFVTKSHFSVYIIPQ